MCKHFSLFLDTCFDKIPSWILIQYAIYLNIAHNLFFLNCTLTFFKFWSFLGHILQDTWKDYMINSDKRKKKYEPKWLTFHHITITILKKSIIYFCSSFSLIEYLIRINGLLKNLLLLQTVCSIYLLYISLKIYDQVICTLLYKLQQIFSSLKGNHGWYSTYIYPVYKA